MKKIHILFLSLMAVCMTSCYSHRVIGYLQEPTKHNKLPQYDSVAYEPYRIRVNDEIIYRLITMDQTIAKSLGANTNNVGGFTKTVTITSNAVNEARVVVKIKGNVVQPDKN